MDTVLAELEAHGVAVLRDAIEPAVVTAARRELTAVASAERDAGTALLEDGSAADGRYLAGVNQRVVGLLGKGDAFRRLAAAPAVLAVMRRVFGDDAVLLSSVTANVANAGGLAMALHADQGFVPRETPYAVLANAIWPLVDFTTANGATRVVPGSHCDGGTSDAIAVEAAAGSVILLDGRTVHGTGANTGDAPRPAVIVTYCRPWVRPFSNHLLELTPATFATMDRELRDLIGCRQWFVHGFSELAYEQRVL
jgi:ectoine hydroxylase-related dioxygenase (phytanoyl-CoA dioxygenase family)